MNDIDIDQGFRMRSATVNLRPQSLQSHRDCNCDYINRIFSLLFSMVVNATATAF